MPPNRSPHAFALVIFRSDILKLARIIKGMSAACSQKVHAEEMPRMLHAHIIDAILQSIPVFFCDPAKSGAAAYYRKASNSKKTEAPLDK